MTQELSEMKTKVLSLLMLCVLAEGAIAVEPITLKLWPDGPPTAMVQKSDATVKLIQSYGDGGPSRITEQTCRMNKRATHLEQTCHPP